MQPFLQRHSTTSISCSIASWSAIETLFPSIFLLDPETDPSFLSMRPSLRRLLASPVSSNPARSSAAKASPLSRRSGKGTARAPPPLTLDQFIQRQRVISLWRTILRSLYKIPKDGRAEPVAYARGEFARNKHVNDTSHIRYLLSTGKAEFDSMQRYIDELASRR